MDNKKIMYQFLYSVNRSKYMPIFLENIFNYKKINTYNYISRCTLNGNSVILDIYDNISDNRFNRYIFIFSNGTNKIEKKDNVYIHYIFINSTQDSQDKLFKLAYLFKIDKYKMLEYANTFLNYELVKILEKRINHK